jgi:hypothetical protein
MTRRTDRYRIVADHLSRERDRKRDYGRHVPLVVLTLVVSLGFMPVASAHGGHVSVNGIHLSQWYGLIPLVFGVGIALGSRYLPRVLRPAYAEYALYGVFVGLAVAVFGAIWMVQLSPVEWYSAQPVIPRTLHGPLMLLIGGAIMLASVLGGQLRWPRQPRYAGFGVVLGLWVAYPGLSTIGIYTPTHPLGYLIVGALAVALCYVLWRDAQDVLRQLYTDHVARRFGIAVGLLSVVFFMFSSGMLYLIPDEGVGISLSQRIIAVLPVADPLVLWPAVEFWFPRLPLGGMISVGTALLIVIFGGLIGLNAALFAFHSERSSPAGASQTTAGIAGIAAPQACCCCGPMLSQIAVVTLGPSAAAPIYLLFADPSSSIGSLFFVASVAILTGTLVRAGQKTPHSAPEQRTAPTNLSS